MNNRYSSHIASSKAAYHKKRAQMPFEEKFKIIIELQKIDAEMIRSNNKRVSTKKLRRVWQVAEA